MKKSTLIIVTVLCLGLGSGTACQNQQPTPAGPSVTAAATEAPLAAQPEPPGPGAPPMSGEGQSGPALDASKPAPDFALKSISGESLHLADLLKKGPVLLVFYKVECPTSAVALPKYETFQKAYQGKGGFSVVGIVQNTTPEIAAYVKQNNLTFPHAEDVGYSVSRAYGIRNTPTLVLLDNDGKAVNTVAGWNRAQSNAVSKAVAGMTGAPYQDISTESDGLPGFRPG